MERPDEPALDAMDAVIAEITAHENRILELKKQLREQTRMLDRVADPPQRLALAAYAYWYMPEVKTEDLAWAVLKTKDQHRLRALIGPVVTGINCDRCGDQLPITSRTQMKTVLERHRTNEAQFAEGYRAVCDPCYDAVFADRRAADDKRARDWEIQAAKLRLLPYDAYLKSEDWRRRRAAHLDHLDSLLRRGSPHQCDVCKAHDGLDVFHKTLASVARERSDDLVVLCGKCRDVLAEAGRIVPH